MEKCQLTVQLDAPTLDKTLYLERVYEQISVTWKHNVLRDSQAAALGRIAYQHLGGRCKIRRTKLRFRITLAWILC